MHIFPALAKQSGSLRSFSSHSIKKRSYGLSSAMVFTLGALLFCCFKMAFKYSVKVLSSVSKYKEAVMCLIEKTLIKQGYIFTSCQKCDQRLTET